MNQKARGDPRFERRSSRDFHWEKPTSPGGSTEIRMGQGRPIGLNRPSEAAGFLREPPPAADGIRTGADRAARGERRNPRRDFSPLPRLLSSYPNSPAALRRHNGMPRSRVIRTGLDTHPRGGEVHPPRRISHFDKNPHVTGFSCNEPAAGAPAAGQCFENPEADSALAIVPASLCATWGLEEAMNGNVFVRIFASRKVWVALAAVAGVIVTLLGADPDKWTPLIAAIVTLAGVVIAAIGYEDAAEKSKTGQLAPGETITMSRTTNAKTGTLAALLLGVLGAALCGGCAADPTARWAQARDTFTQAEKQVLLQHKLGNVSDRDLIALDAFAQAIRSALAAAEQRLPEGGKTFDWYMDLAEDVLTRLSEPQTPEVRDGTGGNSGPGGVGAGDRGGGKEPLALPRAAGGAGAAAGNLHARADRPDQAGSRRDGRRMGRRGGGRQASAWHHVARAA